MQIAIATGFQAALLMFRPTSPADDPTVPDQVQMKGEILLFRDDLLQDLLGLLRPDLLAHQPQPVREAVDVSVYRQKGHAKGEKEHH